MKNLPVKAGEGRSGVGTLASPMGAGAKRQGNRTPGDPRVPTLPPCHPIDSNKIEKPIPHPAFLADGRGPGAHLR